MIRLLLIVALLAPPSLVAVEAEQRPAYLLQIPASVGTLLVAETDTSTLHRFDSRSKNSLQSYMSIGQNGVGKQRPWDRRTPLGIYFVTERLDTQGLHERYGLAAFPLDYPNIWDRKNRRSGDGIWIHGVTPNGGRRPPLDTDGCIALPNDELLAIEDQLVPLVTPVIITRKIRWASPEQVAATRAELGSALETWANSFRAGNLHRYLSLYANDFRYRGMSRQDWAAYRLQTFNNAPVKEFELREVLLLADPEVNDLYLSRFRQRIVDDERTIVTIKRLYWRRSADGDLRIIAEDNG
ncbi:MAG: L,D-transpeptidase family protein [Gammaproteobacteria bacterium]|nr:L,D-transpeptidase family protein [Gammaproteobacteria bacterium]MDH3374486.1 L,D-transpeptidase family protein [Gammaproteobacteria bacterium]